MYLLEIELMRQRRLAEHKKASARAVHQGAYFLERGDEQNLLKRLAKESWHYQDDPQTLCMPEVQLSSPIEDAIEQVFIQDIEHSAQRLVTDILQPSLTIAEIIAQLEQETLGAFPLDQRGIGGDILTLLDDEVYEIDEWWVDGQRGKQ
ncbi:hypothetical protein HGT73_11660 [Rosenbergiella australiborealis]|uniref:Uncharacterized protein n=1 Tax=Rosenbergiella australiborealis TaxID=1544696 RepID=A0ABS5T6P6_9GAMM|nr:hypothetical protein [Rosenbergiella australiborealis]MBT0728021.1 hypothetical protein [Rosenbergiella australiborealis]